MKKLILILSLFIFGCSQPTHELSEIDIQYTDTVVMEDTLYISQDSILRLADKTMKHLKVRNELRVQMIEQIQQQLENNKLTKEQINVLQQQSISYEQQLSDYQTKRVVTKDSVIYNYKYQDTLICKPVYIPDTIYVTIEIVDTIKVKKLKKKKKKNR